jgi:thiosulfate/3-mercaptopyruvate sulfurtransferase
MRPTTLIALAMAPLVIAPRPGKHASPPASVRSLVVTTDWLASHQDDADLVILELTDAADFRSGHIRRARQVDAMTFHSMGTELPPAAHYVAALEALGISNDSRIVLVGDYMSTSLAFVVLDYVGLGDQTVVLDGGKQAWRDAGKPVSTETPSYLKGKLAPRTRQDMVIDAATITLFLATPRLALIDARTPTEFAGAPGEGDSPGHIPGAMNLHWTDTFDGTGRLLPEPTLRELFVKAGYAPGDQLVVYCTVGMRASHLYFVARHLGFTPQLYLGSMNDWISNSQRAVVRGSAN